MITDDVKEKITNDFLKIFKSSIKIKNGDSVFYLYDKNLLFRYKISLLKEKPLDLNKYKNINWENNLIIFEQNKKNKHFWIKYYKYWEKIQSKYNLNYQEIKELFTGILDTHTNCKQYTPPKNSRKNCKY